MINPHFSTCFVLSILILTPNKLLFPNLIFILPKTSKAEPKTTKKKELNRPVEIRKESWPKGFWFTFQPRWRVAAPNLRLRVPNSSTRQSISYPWQKGAEDTQRPITCDLPTADGSLSLTYSPTALPVRGGQDLKNVQCFTTSKLRPSFSAQPWVLLAYSASLRPLSFVPSANPFIRKSRKKR